MVTRVAVAFVFALTPFAVVTPAHGEEAQRLRRPQTSRPTGTAPAQSEEESRDLESRCLHEADNGSIWVSRPIVAPIGMYGVGMSPPIRLGSQVADRLKPLVTHLAVGSKNRGPYLWWDTSPSLHDDDPVILVGFEAMLVGAKDDSPEAADRPSRRYSSNQPEVYEIVSARVRNVEVITREWWNALDNLKECMGQIVSVSATAPGEEKRRRISETMEKAAGALNVMNDAKVSDEWLARIRQVEPRATIIRCVQRSTTEQWQTVLEEYSGYLRIAIRKPLPARMPRFDSVKLLAEGVSAADLLARIKTSWPDDTLESPLIYTSSMIAPGRMASRIVFVRELQDMPPERFGELRAKAKQQLASRERYATSKPAEPPSVQTVEGLHVIVRPAEPDLLADKLVLDGVVVEKVLSPAPGVELKAGDLILNYAPKGGARNLGPGIHSRGSVQQLTAAVRYGGTLHLVRGNQAISVTIAKP